MGYAATVSTSKEQLNMRVGYLNRQREDGVSHKGVKDSSLR